jgi:hypothetical protein
MSLSASRNASLRLERKYRHSDPALVYLLLPYVCWIIELYRIKAVFTRRYLGVHVIFLLDQGEDA